jgi:hypothetical protein
VKRAQATISPRFHWSHRGTPVGSTSRPPLGGNHEGQLGLACASGSAPRQSRERPRASSGSQCTSPARLSCAGWWSECSSC